MGSSGDYDDGGSNSGDDDGGSDGYDDNGDDDGSEDGIRDLYILRRVQKPVQDFLNSK